MPVRSASAGNEIAGRRIDCAGCLANAPPASRFAQVPAIPCACCLTHSDPSAAVTIVRWKLVNVATFVVVMVFNALAGSGALSGESIGLIANRYRSLFLPANYVFGIWSLIYLGLFASTVYQALPLAGATRAVQRFGPWWLVAGLLNVAWVSLFAFAQFAAALAVMVIFLVSLVAAGARLRRGAAAGWDELLFVRWPFDLYLAWIAVALIANSFQFAQVVGFSGFGITEATWAVSMMVVATLLGTWMAWGWGMWLFPPVVAWALHGIGVRYADLPALATAAAWLVPAGLTLGALAWWLGRRRVPDPPVG